MFTLSISVFILLLFFSWSQFHLSTSVKLPHRFTTTNKQQSCTASSGCPDGFDCVNPNASPCSSSDEACGCAPANFLCTPESGCPSGASCLATDSSPCSSADQVCFCLPDSLSDLGSTFDPDSLIDPPNPNNAGNDTKDDPDEKDEGKDSKDDPDDKGDGDHGNDSKNDSDKTDNDNDNNDDDDDDEVCVDANLLSHLPVHELVYKSHRRASVLCDKTGSCATPGHIVVFNGRAMMMSSYCNKVGDCQRRVMNVNSPKMNRKVRLATKTDGLHFTALASRYQTVLEERFLSTLIHMSM